MLDALKLCRSCSAQFPESFRRCLHCGARLRPRPGASSAADALACIAQREPSFAEALADRLTREAITFRLVPDGGTRRVDVTHGSAGHEARVAVWVRAADLESAQRIQDRLIAELLPDLELEALAAEPDACPACAASVPDAAHRCPACGLAFPRV